MKTASCLLLATPVFIITNDRLGEEYDVVVRSVPEQLGYRAASQ